MGQQQKTLLMVGGTALAAASAYGIYNHFQADAPDINTTPPDNTPPANTPPVAEMTPEQVQEAARLTSEDWNALSQQNETAAETETAPSAEPVIDVNNLTPEQQHDIKMLFLRDPASANQMLDDGQWHSSAELQKMWESGAISDDLKAQMVTFSGERFDDQGHFINADGSIDQKMENQAKEWQARHDAAKPEGEQKVEKEVDDAPVDVKIDDKINLQVTPLDESLLTPVEPANETGTGNGVVQDSEDKNDSDIKKIKIRDDKNAKIVINGEDGREVIHTNTEGLETLTEQGIDKVKYHNNGDITVRQHIDGGDEVIYTLNNKGEYVSYYNGNQYYSPEQLEAVNANPTLLEQYQERYQMLQEIRNNLTQDNTPGAEVEQPKVENSENPAAVSDKPEASQEYQNAAQMRESFASEVNNRGLEGFKTIFERSSDSVQTNGVVSSSLSIFGEAENGYAMTSSDGGASTFMVDENGHGHFQTGSGDNVSSMSYDEAKKFADVVFKGDSTIDSGTIDKMEAMSGALYQTDAEAFTKDTAQNMGISVDDKVLIIRNEHGTILLSNNGVSMALENGHTIGCSIGENGELKCYGGIYGAVDTQKNEGYLQTLAKAAHLHGQGDTPIGQALAEKIGASEQSAAPASRPTIISRGGDGR